MRRPFLAAIKSTTFWGTTMASVLPHLVFRCGGPVTTFLAGAPRHLNHASSTRVNTRGKQPLHSYFHQFSRRAHHIHRRRNPRNTIRTPCPHPPFGRLFPRFPARVAARNCGVARDPTYFDGTVCSLRCSVVGSENVRGTRPDWRHMWTLRRGGRYRGLFRSLAPIAWSQKKKLGVRKGRKKGD